MLYIMSCVYFVTVFVLPAALNCRLKEELAAIRHYGSPPGPVWVGVQYPCLLSHLLRDDEPLESRLRFYPSRLCPSELGAGAVEGNLIAWMPDP